MHLTGSESSNSQVMRTSQTTHNVKMLSAITHVFSLLDSLLLCRARAIWKFQHLICELGHANVQQLVLCVDIGGSICRMNAT